MSVLSNIRNSSGLYPITQFYIVAVITVTIAVQGWIGLGTAIAILGCTAVLAVLIAAWAELRQIHTMVDGQRTETLARMDQLEDIISRAGITLPPEDGKVTEAKVEDAANE